MLLIEMYQLIKYLVNTDLFKERQKLITDLSKQTDSGVIHCPP